jgi:hypothetical protein
MPTVTRIELSDGGIAPSAEYPWAVSGTVNVGDVVALSAAAPKTILRADADNAAARPPIGICIGRSGSLAQVALNGDVASGLSGLTRGSVYYLSTTAGALTATAPGSNIYPVGIATSATELLVDSSQADLAGGGGGAGSVTSFGITSSDFTVSNSPVTTSGDVGLSLNTVGVAKGGTGLTSASEQGAMPYATSTSAYTMQSVSPTFKNRVINGGMAIAQRGTAAVTSTGSTAAFAVDRWPFYNATATAISAQQSSDAPAGFSHSLLISTTSAVNSTAAQNIYFIQRIEGSSVYDLAYGTASAKTLTVSFWVKSSVTGLYSNTVALYPVGGSNVTSYISTFTISQANTWERKTFQVPGNTTYAIPNTSNGVGIYFSFDLGSGTNAESTAGSWLLGDFTRTSACVKWANNASATFQITGVQLEVGSVATNFELRPQQVELALCQRYFYRLSGPANMAVASGVATSTANVLAYTKYPQAMRATPTISAVTLRIFPYSAAGVVGAVNYGDNSAALNISGGSRTAGQGAIIAATTTASYLDFSAEL